MIHLHLPINFLHVVGQLARYMHVWYRYRPESVLRTTLRHIEFFRMAMRTKSITKTAQALNVSQPAVSHALKEMELQLGITLFVRANGKIRATAEAVELQPDVDRIYGCFTAFNLKAEEIKHARGGQINIAAIPVLAMATIPKAMGLLKRDRPSASVTLRSMTTSDVIAQVKDERVQLGFIARPIEEPGVGLEPLMSTDFCCFLPDGHRLTHKALITAEDLRDETVIAIGTINPPGIVFRADAAPHAQIVTVETNNAFTAAAMVRAGVGVAVIDPLPLCDHPTDGITVRPFAPSFALTVSAVFSRKRPLSKMEIETVAHVRKVLHQYVDILRDKNIPAQKI